MTNVSSTDFNFRSKFKKFLNEQNYSSVIKAFENFCFLEPKEAINTLWNLTYSNEVAVIELQELGLEVENTDNILLLRNELRFQYEKLHPGFLKKDIPEECKEAYSTLERVTDPITSYAVCTNCVAVLLYNSDLNWDRISFLLQSEYDNYHFGGIRELLFDMKEAQYLKPFHMEICNLLTTIREYYPMEDNTEQITECDQIQDEQEEKVDEEEYQDTDSEYYEFKPVIPEEILAHRSVFESMFRENDLNFLIPIGQFGFDLNEVMKKKEKIRDFLLAAKYLEEDY